MSGPLFAEPETAPRIETRDIVATLPVVELVEPDPVALQPVALEEVLLPLWEDAPRPEDVEQGEMGNCPLAATFIAMAHTRPRTLMERIREEPAEVRSRRRSDPPGTFPYRATRIYRAAFAGYPEATVSSLLYRTHGNIAYARSAGGRVAWVSFLEKAYVVARNASYEQMNVTGGRGGWPMDQIFRDVAGEYAFLDFGADPPPSSAEVRRMVERASSRPTIAGTETGVLETEGIVAHHAYAVLGWTRNRVQLRDPRGGVNAVKQLSLEDFQRTFRLLLQTAEEAG